MQVYQTEAEKHGLSLKSCPHSERDFSLPARPGDYRYILHKPSDVSFQLLRYAEPDQDLALTQLEKLEGRELKEHVILVSSTESKPSPPSSAQGNPLWSPKMLTDHRAVIHKFQLRVSAGLSIVRSQVQQEAETSSTQLRYLEVGWGILYEDGT